MFLERSYFVEAISARVYTKGSPKQCLTH